MKRISPITTRAHFTSAFPTPSTSTTNNARGRQCKCYSQWFRQLADSVLRHDHGQVAALLKSIPAHHDPNTPLADPRGTTLLHLACSLNKHRCVSALVSHPSVNVNLPDLESEWTPLHRALYTGNLRAANHLLLHPQINLSAIDAHGHTPLHLTHHLTLPPLPLTAPTDLFSWGSNANYVLGHGHSNIDSSASSSHPSSSNAHDPQPKRASFRPNDNLATYLYTPEFSGMPTITHLSVAKYHACMLTHDPTTNQTQLYMWGYASGGRLGSTATSAVVKPTLAQFDDGTPTFTAVAAAHNHTLAITTLGTVWVWGSNQFGQCGLSLDTAEVDALAKGYPKAYVGGGGSRRATSDAHIAPRPLTTGHLKREPMAPNGGVAASKIHSCVWTCASLVTFGLNVGQLGHGRDSIIVQPRKVASLPADACIVDVKCTERFTLVVLDSGAAYVLQDFTTRRLKLAPVAGIRGSELGKAAGWSQAAPMRPPAVSKICVQDSGGVSFGAVVTVQGNVCAWSVTGIAHPPPVPGSAAAVAAAASAGSSGAEGADMQDEGKKVKSALKWTPPKYVWTPTGSLRGAGNAVDVAIGLDGALALVTEFGCMYSLRSSWAGAKMPTWNTFALDRVTHVFANGHGSWFALRSNAVFAVPKEATADERAREWHRPGRDEDAWDVPDKVVLVSAEGTRHEIATRLVFDFDWFQTALSSSWTSDSDTPTIALTHFSSSTLTALHTWLHTRTFSLPYPALLSLLTLADFLLLDYLKAQLAHVLAQCASPHNLVDLLNTSLDVNAKHLERACARLVVVNFAYLAKKHAMGNEAWDQAVVIAERVCKEEQDGFAPLCNGWKRAVDRPVIVAKMAGWNWYFPVAASGSAAVTTAEKVEAPAAPAREEGSPVQDENTGQLGVGHKALPVTPKQQMQHPATTVLPSPPPPPKFAPVAVKKVSLAQIQAQEEAKKRQRRAVPVGEASPSTATSSSPRPATAPSSAPASTAVATSPVPIRLANVSQKERKRQSKVSSGPEPAVAQAPWAPPHTSPASSSLPAIAPAAGGGGGSSSTSLWSKPSATAAASPIAAGSSSLWPSLASVATPVPTSPAAGSSFAAIQKEQLKAKSTKHQQVKKALAEIQIEEAAMAQLMDRFRARRGAGLVSGEMMSVVVVPR